MRTWLRRTIARCTLATAAPAPEPVVNLTPSENVSPHDRAPCRAAPSHRRQARGDYYGGDAETQALTRIYDSVNVIRARTSDLIATPEG